MANMSYCRFQNTASDFQDCVNAIEHEELSDLSSDEQWAAKRLYELAQDFVKLYERALQSSAENSDDNDKKRLFLQYYKVQMKSDYNMITERELAAKAAGLTLSMYDYIQSNYNTFRSMFSSDCEIIDKQIMEELHHEG